MKLSLPLSILLASVVIALGLYFGLRTPTPTVAPPPKAPDPMVVTPGEAAPPVASLPQAPPVPTEAQNAANVTSALIGVHPSWRAACWDTADPATRKAGRYVASVAFDATGKLVIFGVSEDRETSDPVVAECLRGYPNTFSIPAPGHPASFEVPFQMP